MRYNKRFWVSLLKWFYHPNSTIYVCEHHKSLCGDVLHVGLLYIQQFVYICFIILEFKSEIIL